MSDRALRASIIRLAHSHPEFRKELLPLITAGKEAADRGTGGYVLRVEKGKYRGSYRFSTPQEAVSAAGDHASFSDKDETKGLALLREGKPWSVDSSAGSFTISPPKGKSAGCEKLPEGGMRDNCEKKQEEGKSKEAATQSYDEYVRDYEKLRKKYPRAVPNEPLSKAQWEKLMGKDEGEKKEASSERVATTAIIRKSVTITVRVASVKSLPPTTFDVGFTEVRGLMTLDFGSDQPDAIRFTAVVEDKGGGWDVRDFQTQRAVSGSGAEILLGVLKSAFEEALEARGDALLGTD